MRDISETFAHADTLEITHGPLSRRRITVRILQVRNFRLFTLLLAEIDYVD